MSQKPPAVKETETAYGQPLDSDDNCICSEAPGPHAQHRPASYTKPAALKETIADASLPIELESLAQELFSKLKLHPCGGTDDHGVWHDSWTEKGAVRSALAQAYYAGKAAHR